MTPLTAESHAKNIRDRLDELVVAINEANLFGLQVCGNPTHLYEYVMSIDVGLKSRDAIRITRVTEL